MILHTFQNQPFEDMILYFCPAYVMHVLLTNFGKTWAVTYWIESLLEDRTGILGYSIPKPCTTHNKHLSNKNEEIIKEISVQPLLDLSVNLTTKSPVRNVR